MYLDPITNTAFTTSDPPLEERFMNLPQFGLDAAQLAKGRTDLYLIGLPGSGKTCLLASVLKYLTDTGGLRYVTKEIKKNEDRCKAYYQGLIDGLGENLLPLPTKMDTLVPMEFKIGSRYKRPITMVEHSGKAMKTLSEVLTTGEDVWHQTGLGQCLKNDNPKTLLFIFDYSMLTARNTHISAVDQELTLQNVLNVLSTDGTGRNGEKDCTMSKVKNVAVVITKSDLMEEDNGRTLTQDERSDIAFQYLMDRCSAFMNHLGDLCMTYDINASNKNHPNEIYVTTFSLGSFTAEGLQKLETVYTMRLADYIVASTPPKRGLFGRL